MASISQLAARLVDLFGNPANANPAKLMGNLQISPAGNVLVGTSTDDATNKLQVNGAAKVTGALTVTGATTSAGATVNGALTVTGTATSAGATVNGQLLINSGNAFKLSSQSNTYSTTMRADDTGFVGLINNAGTAWNMTVTDAGGVNFPRARPTWAGVTPWDTGNFNPSNYAALSGALFAGGISVSTNSISYTVQGMKAVWNEDGSGAGALVCNKGGGSGGFVLRTINVDNSAEMGRFVISAAGAGSQGSDVRLKDDIETLSGALEKLRQIRGVSYTYKASGERHYGVIAQEVRPYFPDAVTEIGSGVDEGKDDYLGVSYSDLIAPLIEAVKELADKHDAALLRIADLEKQLEKA
jgi:hypothetical protein